MIKKIVKVWKNSLFNQRLKSYGNEKFETDPAEMNLVMIIMAFIGAWIGSKEGIIYVMGLVAFCCLISFSFHNIKKQSEKQRSEFQ